MHDNSRGFSTTLYFHFHRVYHGAPTAAWLSLSMSHLCERTSMMVARKAGSLCSIRCSRSLHEALTPLNWSIDRSSFLLIKAYERSLTLSSQKGHLLVKNQWRMQPRLKTSHAMRYGSPKLTSGAMKPSEPMRHWLISLHPRSLKLTPKSAMQLRASGPFLSISMLSGLMSRCTIYNLCKSFRPSATSRTARHATFSN